MIHRRSLFNVKKIWVTLILLILIFSAAVIIAVWPFDLSDSNAEIRQNTEVVPASVQKSVSFPIYYPDPVKLPAGCKLNKSSFSSPVKNGVSYSVSCGNNKIVFSVQSKPSESELDTFNKSYIPLRNTFQTPVGEAEIGAYHNKTLTSLPIPNGPWVIITAPPTIDQSQLKSILSSIRR